MFDHNKYYRVNKNPYWVHSILFGFTIASSRGPGRVSSQQRKAMEEQEHASRNRDQAAILARGYKDNA